MPLILALGSNIGDKESNLEKARDLISYHFDIIEEGKILKTAPVDYLQQPEFLNQALECRIPSESPLQVLEKLKEVEKKLGRKKSEVPKGPRIIDIDILFWEDKVYSNQSLTIPHQEIPNRKFIFEIIKDLPYFKKNEISSFHRLITLYKAITKKPE